MFFATQVTWGSSVAQKLHAVYQVQISAKKIDHIHLRILYSRNVILGRQEFHRLINFPKIFYDSFSLSVCLHVYCKVYSVSVDELFTI